MNVRWVGAVLLLALAAVSVAVMAADSSGNASNGTLWGVTALGGVGGVAITQAIKKAVNKVFPNLLGAKSTYTLAQVASFGVGVAAYFLFPSSREQILSQGIAIFQGGATATALSSGIYKLFGNFLGMKSTTA